MPFIRPTLDELEDRNEASLASKLGLGRLVPRGFLRAIARMLAGLAHGLYGYVDWVYRQALPDTADPERMEQWANDFGVIRKPATFAEGPVLFTGANNVDLPAGTLVQRADGVQFEVLADAVLTGGSESVTVRAVVAGDLGDTEEAAPLTLVSPVVGVNSDALVDTGGIVGGEDEESDAELLARLLAKMRNPPMGGSAADYEQWALEVPGVTRAWCLPEHFGPGTVGLTFAVDDDPAGPIPDSTKVDEVQAYIDARRPVPVSVFTVFAPLAQVVFVQISSLDPDTPDVRASIENALAELLRREGGPGQTLLISHVREAISNAAGERDHLLDFPVGNTNIAAGKIAVLDDPPVAWM